MNKTWAGAIAIFLGSVTGALIVKEIDDRRAIATIQKMQAEFEAEPQASNRATQEFNRQQAIKAQREERLRQAAIYEQQAAIAFQQNAAAARDQAEFNAKIAEETEWKKFYRHSAACEKNWTGDCADAFIVAKRAFKEQYRSGVHRLRDGR